VADRPYFTRLRETPGNALVFSDALIARTTGHLSIVIARGVRDKAGAFLGVTTALLDLEAFAKLLSGIDVGAQGASVLRRSDSFTLALRQPPSLASDFKHPLPESNPVRQRIEAGELTGTLAYTSDTDGVERIASFRKLDHGDGRPLSVPGRVAGAGARSSGPFPETPLLTALTSPPDGADGCSWGTRRG
jgi:hypothetical protein